MSFVAAALSNAEDGLWRRVHEDRDPAARDQLVERYLPYARQLAASLFARRPDNDVEFGDYMQFASIGLIEAVDRYQASKGAMFKTFAGYRIKGAVLNGIKTITERRDQYTSLQKYAGDRLTSLSGHTEGEQTADSFSMLVNTIVGLALGYMLDASGEGFAGGATQATDPYNSQAYRQTCARIEGAVATLNEREQRIIRYHYYHQMSFERLADLYGVSKGRISQLHKQALTRLREYLQQGDKLDRHY